MSARAAGAAGSGARLGRTDADFEAFVAERLPRLLKLGRALAGDEHRGADLVQDALERMFLTWSTVQNPEAFVRRTMVNRNVSVWRKLRRERPLPDREDLGLSSTEERFHDHELFAAVRQLPPRQRAVIALRYYEDLTEAQTAEVLGCSVGTVKRQAAEAMAKLRALLPMFTERPDDQEEGL